MQVCRHPHRGICPFTKSLAFALRNTAAPCKSLGSPQTPAGVLFMINSLKGCPSFLMGFVCSVAKITWANSVDLNIMGSPFDTHILSQHFQSTLGGSISPTVFLPNSLIMEQMLMILPALRWIIPLTTALETIKGLTKSTLTTYAQNRPLPYQPVAFVLLYQHY